jgi:hypothetical protein
MEKTFLSDFIFFIVRIRDISMYGILNLIYCSIVITTSIATISGSHVSWISVVLFVYYNNNCWNRGSTDDHEDMTRKFPGDERRGDKRLYLGCY